MLFDAVDKPIPLLRTDLEIIPYEEEGEQLLIMRDPAGYGDEMVVFKPEAWALFSLFDGRQTVVDLQREIFQSTEVHVDAEQILQIVTMLDEYYFLQSERFFDRKTVIDREFLDSETRPVVHSGQSYPDTTEELTTFLDTLFAADTFDLPDEDPIGIITPHIDLRIGPTVYVPPFKHLARRQDVDTIVILGTSHYSSEDLYILTRKHYETPLGTLETDVEFVDTLRNNTGGRFTTNDIAHKPEHSIEFPALFVKYCMGESVKVVPILVTSFEECIETNTHPSSLAGYETFIEGVNKTAKELGRNIAYVLSVDWSHVGAKFGDNEPASALLDQTRESDHAQLLALENADYNAFREMLVENKNISKIDGFSCISTFFDLVKPSKGKLLIYDQWHEEERQSGVTFAGMSFFK